MIEKNRDVFRLNTGNEFRRSKTSGNNPYPFSKVVFKQLKMCIISTFRQYYGVLQPPSGEMFIPKGFLPYKLSNTTNSKAIKGL